jgi:hypothetical protein
MYYTKIENQIRLLAVVHRKRWIGYSCLAFGLIADEPVLNLCPYVSAT